MLIIFFFGLRPQSWPNINRLEWSQDHSGLAFHAPGFAYVDNLHTLLAKGSEAPFTICLGISAVKQLPGFRPILMLHDGSDADQLSIAQWETSLIMMNGDDYSYRRKLPRLTVDNFLADGKSSCIGITSGADGTRLFDNGALIETRKDLRFHIPAGGKKLHLVLGNSVYGHHYWEGMLFRLALYDRELSPPEMAGFCRQPADAVPAAAAGDEHLLLLYTFGEGSGNLVRDLSGHNQTLRLPSRPMALKQLFLEPPGPHFSSERGLTADIVLNILGFVPLGAALYARLRLSSLPVRRVPALSAILLCFGISLCIEMAQGWMPDRSSTLLDLILNTLGAALGVLPLKICWIRLAAMIRRSTGEKSAA